MISSTGVIPSHMHPVKTKINDSYNPRDVRAHTRWRFQKKNSFDRGNSYVRLENVLIDLYKLIKSVKEKIQKTRRNH